jgi:hypothetical protein
MKKYYQLFLFMSGNKKGVVPKLQISEQHSLKNAAYKARTRLSRRFLSPKNRKTWAN